MQVKRPQPRMRRSALALAVASLLGPVAVASSHAVPVQPSDTIVGDAGLGNHTNTGVLESILGQLVLGNQGGGDGTYTVTGGTAQTLIGFQSMGNGGSANGALVIGNAGSGSFIQGLANGSDGSNLVSVAGDLVLGAETGSTGSYTLNTGALTVGGQLAVGGQSTGNNVFTQNGGSLVLTGLANGPNANNPDYAPIGGAAFGPWGGALAIGGAIGNGDGSLSGGNGSYVLNAGTIDTYNLLIGPTGTGTMTQSGGAVNTTFFTIAFGGTGTYNLSGGSITTYSAAVGYAGVGVFNQSGGTHTVRTSLSVGQQYSSNSPGSGAYHLTGGTLNSGNTFIGQGETGTFVLNDQDAPGTTHNVTGNLAMGTSSVAWDGSSPTSFGTGSYTITGNTALNVLLAPGGNGAADPPGSNGYDSSNNPNPAPNGALIVGEFGNGTFVQGVLGGTDAPGVYVAGDLVLGNQAASLGQYTLNTGSLTVDGKIVVGGASTNGNLFMQNAGTVTITGNAAGNADYIGVGTNDWIGWLNIGGGNGNLNQGVGIYQMNGGVLSASQGIGVGTSGAGIFNQAGGTVTTYNLYLGNCGGCNGSNASGTYNLTGGTLNATYELVGLFGHGEFVQNGASTVNTVSGDLQIATGPFPTPETGLIPRSGSYTLVAGTLNTTNTIVAVQGVGSFTQSGGFHNVANALTVGQQYTIPNGQVPISFGGAAPGVYTLTGGVLTATNAIVVGDAGMGTMNHLGGLVALGTGFDGQILANGQAGMATVGTLTIGATGTGLYKLGATGQANNAAWAGFPNMAGAPPPSFDDAVNAPFLQVYGNVLIGRDGAGNSLDGNGNSYAHGLASGGFVLAGDGSVLQINNVVGTQHNGSMVLGLNGSGSFTQSDASKVALDGGLALGINASSVGSYTLNGGANGSGTLSVGGDLNIGGSDDASGGPLSQTTATAGSGSFFQNAGAVNVSGHLSIATDPGAVGSYALAGGSLTVVGPAFIGNNGGSGSFIQTGGSVQVGGLLLGTSPATGPASLGTYFITGSGSSLTVAGDTQIAAAPGTADSAMTIGNGSDTPTVNFNGYLTVGGGDAGSLMIQSGTVTVALSTYVGGSPSGVGSITQTGGSFTTGFLDIGTVTGSGSPGNRYTLSGNGSANVLFNMVVGSGSLGGNPDGSGGSFNQSGVSTTTVSGGVYVNNGSVNLTGGTFNVGGNVILGDTKTGAQFKLSGGTTLASISGDFVAGNAAGLIGDTSLTGGSTLAVNGYTFVGAAGIGSLANVGSAHSTQALVIGQQAGSTGTYLLSSGGTVDVGLATGGFIDVGENGTGTYTQTGGSTHIEGALDIGRFGGASGPGTFNISGGSVTVDVHTATAYGGFAVVGDAGVGVVNQSGASVVTLAGSLEMGRAAGGRGTYNLSGGQLNVVGTVTVQTAANSSGTLNVGGGALNAAGVVNNGLINFTGGTMALAAGAGTLANNAGAQFNFAGTRLLTGSLSNAGHLTPTSATDQISVSGSFAQTAQGSLDVLLGGASGASLIAVSGAATLDGTLDLICYGTCTYVPGTVITILTAAGGVSGAFSGSPVLTGFAPGTFTVDYSVPDEVVLRVTAVPEPGTYALLLAGLAMLGAGGRRRTRTD